MGRASKHTLGFLLIEVTLLRELDDPILCSQTNHIFLFYCKYVIRTNGYNKAL